MNLALVMAGLGPAISLGWAQRLTNPDHRVTLLRGGPVMTG
jgi:hypothetical protein